MHTYIGLHIALDMIENKLNIFGEWRMAESEILSWNYKREEEETSVGRIRGK
jgi:hypothetical protein